MRSIMNTIKKTDMNMNKISVVFLLFFNVMTATSQSKDVIEDGGISASGRTQSDSARLSALNKQFIRNFLQQDVAAHNEIIHPNFVCIESDGSIVHREEYLKNWASDYDH